jgi:hypothetical protein
MCSAFAFELEAIGGRRGGEICTGEAGKTDADAAADAAADDDDNSPDAKQTGKSRNIAATGREEHGGRRGGEYLAARVMSLIDITQRRHNRRHCNKNYHDCRYYYFTVSGRMRGRWSGATRIQGRTAEPMRGS